MGQSKVLCEIQTKKSNVDYPNQKQRYRAVAYWDDLNEEYHLICERHTLDAMDNDIWVKTSATIQKQFICALIDLGLFSICFSLSGDTAHIASDERILIEGE